MMYLRNPAILHTYLSGYIIVLHLSRSIALEDGDLMLNRMLLQPNEVNVSDYGPTFITLSWYPAILDSYNELNAFNGHHAQVHYQVWHWPVNASLELVMSTTFTTTFTISHLVPGQSYSLWVLGIEGNVTSDYVTLLQTTGVCDFKHIYIW